MKLIMIFKYLSFALTLIPINAYSDTIAKDIFTKYRNANNYAFDAGDNASIKKLYSGDIESCWVKNNINYSQSSINPPIPLDAEYSLTNLKDSEYNPLNNSDFKFHKDPTHIFSISYKNKYFSSCSNSIESPSTTIYLYVYIDKTEFNFPGICPSTDLLESIAAKVNTYIPNELSLPFVRYVLNSLTEKEKDIIKISSIDIKSFQNNINEINKIGEKYRISAQSMAYIEYELCKKHTNK